MSDVTTTTPPVVTPPGVTKHHRQVVRVVLFAIAGAAALFQVVITVYVFKFCQQPFPLWDDLTRWNTMLVFALVAVAVALRPRR